MYIKLICCFFPNQPGNFLCSIKRQDFLLVDFGLAEKDKTIAEYPFVVMSSDGAKTRPSRTGTRGFRAPEVLMKSLYQSTALDVWSAGVILLSMLSDRYPFFSSPDDLTSLVEVSCIVGTAPLQTAAERLLKKIHFPETKPPRDLRALCSLLRVNSPNNVNTKHADFLTDAAFDFLSKCLTADPFSRIAAEQALQHPFLAD
eukprot:TRINITY_DN933_c0_g1_i2.p1 TRINITY_DN933_c0_g1~~TRINITY_DN933_c0_g1_i2.p1  ORF type:complete len:201 (+),score=32.17 TRINITY_DN933_c0_g1_i2:395-997(+)